MEDYPGNPGGKIAKNQNLRTRVRTTDLLYCPLISYHCAISPLLLEILERSKFQRSSGNCS